MTKGALCRWIQKGDKVYVHILNWNATLLALPPIREPIAAAENLRNGSPVEFTQRTDGLIVKVPALEQGERDRVIVLTLAQGGHASE